MLPTPSRPSSLFSASLPDLQVVWDSTSLGCFKECPRKYYYQYIIQRQPKGTKIDLSFGIHYHKALEIYEKLRLQQLNHDEAQIECVDYCMKQTDLDVFENPYKNRKTLTRSVIWYLEEFKHDPLETYILDSGKPAVELSFKLALPDDGTCFTPEGDPFLLSGHIDKVCTVNGHPLGVDHKTTKSALTAYYFKQYTPNNQIDLYSFALGVILPEPAKGFVINACQILVDGNRYHRDIVHRSPGQISEWQADTRVWLNLAMQFAEQQFWPMNTKSCGNFGGCTYIPICSLAPSNRERWLAGPAYESGLWDPTVDR